MALGHGTVGKHSENGLILGHWMLWEDWISWELKLKKSESGPEADSCLPLAALEVAFEVAFSAWSRSRTSTRSKKSCLLLRRFRGGKEDCEIGVELSGLLILELTLLASLCIENFLHSFLADFLENWNKEKNSKTADNNVGRLFRKMVASRFYPFSRSKVTHTSSSAESTTFRNHLPLFAHAVCFHHIEQSLFSNVIRLVYLVSMIA